MIKRLTTACLFFALFSIVKPTLAQENDASSDLVAYMERPEAKLMLVIPAGVDPVRGVIIHGANKSLKPDDLWTETARSLGYAHLVAKIDMKKTRRPRRLRLNVTEGLVDYAKQLQRPELAEVPFATVGHSAGGMALPALHSFRERFITAANDCSWIYSENNLQKAPHMAQVPLLFTIGAVPDDFKMIPAIEQDYDPNRAKGSPWSLGFEWGKSHSVGNSLTLFASWFKAIDAIRLSEDGQILETTEAQSWLGSREDWDSAYPTIAPYADYTGDKKTAVWLPNRAFAYTWRAYQSQSPFQLSISEPKPLKDKGPGNKLEIRIRPGQTISLGIKGGGELQQVRYFLDDQLIAESSESPWNSNWTAEAGTHAIHAQWTLKDGSVGVTRPALIVATEKRNKKTIQFDLREP